MKHLVEFIKESLIIEGGNIWEDSSKIKMEDIKPTLEQFVKTFRSIFPDLKKQWFDTADKLTTLGSVGKKPISGDIDIAIDSKAFEDTDQWGLDMQKVSQYFAQFKKRARTASDESIMHKAIVRCIAEKINAANTAIVTNEKKSTGDEMFNQFDQYGTDGKPNGLRVQIDINFGDIDWLKFAYYSDSYKGNVKGLHRTQLMLHLFAYKGYMFKHAEGVINKETREVEAKHPEDAVKLLNKLYHFNITRDILSNYFKTQEYLKKNLDEKELHAIWDIYLQTLDHTRCDIPEDLQPYWMENQDRLKLTGKFLPEDSNLYKLRKA